jgi:hypothetical protein
MVRRDVRLGAVSIVNASPTSAVALKTPAMQNHGEEPLVLAGNGPFPPGRANSSAAALGRSAMSFALGQLLVDYMPADLAFETLKKMAEQTGPIMEQLEADMETIH